MVSPSQSGLFAKQKPWYRMADEEQVAQRCLGSEVGDVEFHPERYVSANY